MLKNFKLLVVTVFIVLSLGMTSFAAVNTSTNQNQAVESLGKMNILNNSEVREFNRNGYLTRGQLAKIAVSLAGKSDEAMTLNISTVYPDVSRDYPYAGYINATVKYNLMTGYADGMFKPDENANYSQVVTVLIRTLGYGSSEMLGIWPDNYITKARSLNITNGISLNPSDNVSYDKAALMAERTALTNAKGNVKVLGELSGLGVAKTGIITGLSDADNTLSAQAVKMDIGEFKSSLIKETNLGRKADVLVDPNNEIIAFREIDENGHLLYINSINANEIKYSNEKGDSTLNLSNNLSVYYNGAKYSFMDIKMGIKLGSLLSVVTDDTQFRSFDYAVLMNPVLSQPQTVLADVDSSTKAIGNIDISSRSSFSVIKNGKGAGFSDIKLYDIVYLSKNPFKNGGTLFVYDNKVIGTYDEAYPDKYTVNKVTVSGKQYDIETSTAAAKLNGSSGALDIGDEVTLLLGKDGKVADVISPYLLNSSNLAVVINARKGALSTIGSSNNQYYYIKLYTADGRNVEYPTKEDQTNNKGKVVRYYLRDNVVEIETMNSSSIGGMVDFIDKKIGDTWLAQDAAIFDMNYVYGSENDIPVRKVSISELPQYIDSNKVMDVIKGGPFSDIQLLVLNNVIKPDQYGIITAKSDKPLNYTIMYNGKPISYNTSNSYFNSISGDVVYFENSGNNLTSMSTIIPVDNSDEIQAYDTRRIKINNKVYVLSKDVQIYDVTGQTPVQIDKGTLTSGKYSFVGVYQGASNGRTLVKMITIIREVK